MINRCAQVVRKVESEACMKHKLEYGHQIKVKEKGDSLYIFCPTLQDADTITQCAECDKWRLVFSKKKLTEHQLKKTGD